MRATEPERANKPVLFLILALAMAASTGWAISAAAYLSFPQQTALVLITLTATVTASLVHVHYAKLEESGRQSLFEQRLEQSEERLRQAQKMEAVGQLAGGIAHDFNNLVTVIGCSVGLLTEATAQDDPRQDDLQQIKDAADRAAALTRQLLAFSRRQILQPKMVDLNTVVYEMEKMLQRVLGKHIVITTSLDPNSALIRADLGQIEQVLMNLAVNARDAMPNGGTLTFTTANRSISMEQIHKHGTITPGEYVTLSVQDTGQGIPSAAMPHLFEPFFTTKEAGKGTGIGLTTVHGIVYQSNGHITVESSPNKGTRFTLYFPRAIGDRPLMLPAGQEPTTSQPSNDTPDRLTVLIVDDEEAILDIGLRALQQAGYTVFAARHGEEALSVLARCKDIGDPVDLVLTDVVMPVMGGRDLINAIKRQYPDTKVLCMSGYTREELLRQRLIDPNASLVHKPFELTALLKAIRDTLSQASSLEDLDPAPLLATYSKY